MNMLKKNDGFTLVELIVVIAIIAILSGVAVAGYSGYIKSANKSADTSALEAVNTAIASALAMEGKNTTDFTTYFSIDTNDAKKITPKDIDTTKEGTQNKVWDNFEDFYGEQTDDTLTFSFDYFTGVEFKDGKLQGIEPTT